MRISLRTGAAGLAIAAMLLAFPAAALATEYVPPGLSGVNQYTEVLPGPGGNHKVERHHGSPARALGKKNAARLEGLGPEGRAAAAAAALGGPGHREQVAARKRRERSGSPFNSGPGSSGLGKVVGQATALSSEGGVGLMLPLIIVASIIGAAAYVATRRRAAGR